MLLLIPSFLSQARRKELKHQRATPALVGWAVVPLFCRSLACLDRRWPEPATPEKQVEMKPETRTVGSGLPARDRRSDTRHWPAHLHHDS